MNKALYASYYGSDYRLVFFDPATEARFAAMKKLFGSREYAMESWSADFKRIVFRLSDGRLKGRFYLYDHETGRARLIHGWSEGLAEADMGEVKTAVFPARDGREIEAILTFPAGRPRKDLPVVVNAHGGPHLRDTVGFNDINQFFASRGYLVMQVNYRGSQGYGDAFMRAGFKQWGLLMQDDLTDGVAWLNKQGWADPARIAIYGFSSGGYSALAGLTLTPDLYACGLAVSGNVNLISSFKTNPPAAHEAFGDPAADAEKLAAASPSSHVDAVRAPLLIANGVKDRGIPIQDVDEFVAALKKRGLDVEYLRYENSGHNILYNPELKLEVLKKAEAFLEKHLGNKR
jgi:dipeptidyl aminopeptidase/acylaminoacyl peptidase